MCCPRRDREGIRGLLNEDYVKQMHFEQCKATGAKFAPGYLRKINTKSSKPSRSHLGYRAAEHGTNLVTIQAIEQIYIKEYVNAYTNLSLSTKERYLTLLLTLVHVNKFPSQ